MLEKSLAVGIFVLFLGLVISGRVHRTTAALLAAVLVVGLRLVPEARVVDYVHWEVLALVFGMFVIVAGLAESGFFRWVGLHTLQFAKFRPLRTFVLFSALSAILAAFLDSITVLLFMAPLALEACRILKVPPLPYLVACITSANIGGAATMVGDPPNVIIGVAFNLSFTDFVLNTAPFAVAAFGLNLAVLYALSGRVSFTAKAIDLSALPEHHSPLDPFLAVKDLRLMRLSLSVFAATVTLLVLHQALDLVVAFVAVLGATVLLLLGGRDLPDLVQKVDWQTIVFLAGLFVAVGALVETGVVADLANGLSGVSGGNLPLMLTLLLWTAALGSALMDNIPLTAAFVPVITGMAAASGAPVAPLAYTLALGADVGGNATPIGASDTVVGLAVAEKEGVHVTWREYTRLGVPAMLACVVLFNVLVLLFYH